MYDFRMKFDYGINLKKQIYFYDIQNATKANAHYYYTCWGIKGALKKGYAAKFSHFSCLPMSIWVIVDILLLNYDTCTGIFK